MWTIGCQDDSLCMGNINHVNMIFVTEESAIETWNTRKPMERIVEQLEDKNKELTDISSKLKLSNEQKAQNYGYAVAINHAIEIVRSNGRRE